MKDIKREAKNEKMFELQGKQSAKKGWQSKKKGKQEMWAEGKECGIKDLCTCVCAL